MSPTKSNCEKCGTVFESTGEVTSSKVLCAACAAERRAQIKAAKAAQAAGAPASARATAAAPAAAPATARAAAPSRAQSSAPSPSKTREARAVRRKARGEDEENEQHDGRHAHESDDKKIAKIGWMAVGGLTLVTLLVLVFVMNAHNTRNQEQKEYEEGLKAFMVKLEQVKLDNEVAVKAALDLIASTRNTGVTNRNTGWFPTPIAEKVQGKKSLLNATLGGLVDTRNLTAKLDAINAQLTSNPGIDVLGQQFTAIRDAELAAEAKGAGDKYLARYDQVLRTVTDRYLQELRKAVGAAASATTGDALGAYGQYEDALRVQFQESTAASDASGIASSKAEIARVSNEINGIVARLFDDAYLNKVTEKQILGTEGWLATESPSFKHNVTANSLTMNNQPDGSTGAMTYVPGKDWRDYVITMEVKLDSGTLGVYTRVPVGTNEKLDSKGMPAFTIGTIVGQKSPNVVVEYGKSYNVTVSTIGNKIYVFVDGTMAWNDDPINSSKMRKGTVAFTAQAGTNVTISKLKVKHLR